MNLLGANQQRLQSVLESLAMSSYLIIVAVFLLSLLAIIVPVKLQQAWEAS